MLRLFLERPGGKVVFGSAVGYTSGQAEGVAVGKSGTRTNTLHIKPRDSGSSTSNTPTSIPCTHLILSAGPWTGSLFPLLFPHASKSIQDRVKVTGSRAHSIVLKTHRALSAHALFTDMTLEDGDTAEPEVYARPDGTVYM